MLSRKQHNGIVPDQGAAATTRSGCDTTPHISSRPLACKQASGSKGSVSSIASGFYMAHVQNICRLRDEPSPAHPNSQQLPGGLRHLPSQAGGSPRSGPSSSPAKHTASTGFLESKCLGLQKELGFFKAPNDIMAEKAASRY